MHIAILATLNTLIRRRGQYYAWKCSAMSFPVRIEMPWLMNKMSAKILDFGSHDINHSKFENATKCLHKSWWYLFKHRVCLSHFSELETRNKQMPIQTCIQTRFSDVVFIGPFLVGGIKRLSLLLPETGGRRSEMYTRIKTALRLSPCF